MYRNGYLSLQEATKFCSYSQEYLSLRARSGKLKAEKQGRNWYTTREWLSEYIGHAEEYKNELSEKNHVVSVKQVAPPANLPIESTEKVISSSFQEKKIPQTFSLRFGVGMMFIVLCVGIGFAVGQDKIFGAYEQTSIFVYNLNESFEIGARKYEQKIVRAARESMYAAQVFGRDIGRKSYAIFPTINLAIDTFGNDFDSKFAKIPSGTVLLGSIGDTLESYGEFVTKNAESFWSDIAGLFRKEKKIADINEVSPRDQPARPGTSQEGILLESSAEKTPVVSEVVQASPPVAQAKSEDTSVFRLISNQLANLQSAIGRLAQVQLISGSQGPQGVAGPSGPQGPQGFQGPPGAGGIGGVTILSSPAPSQVSVAGNFETLNIARGNLIVDSGGNLTTIGSLTGSGNLTTLSVSGRTTFNGVAYTWPSIDGTSSQVLSTNGSGTLSWTTVSGGGGAWSSLTNPTANLALTMAANTSTFTFNATTGAGVDLFALTDTASNTGTGSLLQLTTASSSAASPFEVLSQGTGNTVINLASTGDLLIQDAGAAFVTFSDTGLTTFGSGTASTLVIPNISALTGSNNSIAGSGAGAVLTSGTQNTLFGVDAGNAIISEHENTFIGYRAGRLTTVSDNTAIGSQALLSNTTGTKNIAIGNSALSANTIGSDNTVLGSSAGDVLTTGSDNIILGRSADSSGATSSNEFVAGSADAAITNVYFGEGPLDDSPLTYTINGGGGSGTNIAGASITLAGGKATGNATGGSVIFQTSDAGASGSTLQSLSTKMTLLASGNFGIGDTTPDDLLNIYSSSAQAGVAITSEGTDTDALIKFELTDGTANFVMGVDDSAVGDPFKISTTALGTNDMFVLDSQSTSPGVSAITLAGIAPTIASAGDAEYTTLTITSPTITLTGTTQITAQMDSVFISQPTFTDASALTIDDAATLTIAGPPIEAGSVTLSDTYGLMINQGTSTPAARAYGLYVNAPTGAGANYAANLTGGNVGIGDTTPDDLLNIYSSSAEAGIAITSEGSSTDAIIKFELTDGTPKIIMGVDDTGDGIFRISNTFVTGDFIGFNLDTTPAGASSAILLNGLASTTGASGVASLTTLWVNPASLTITGGGTATALMETSLFTGATISGSVAVTINKATNLSLVAPIDGTNATITDDSAMRILNVSSGPGTLTNQYGIYIESLTSGATSDYGIYIAGADTNAIWVDAGMSRFDGGIALDAQQTLTADSTTPSVAAGSHFITANTTGTLISNFTSGFTGQIIAIEVNDINTDFDCTASSLSCGTTDITNIETGDTIYFIRDASVWNMIGWVDDDFNYSAAGGADIAELFPSNEELEAGDVVAVDTSYPVHVRKTTSPHELQLVGIVSTQPGITLGDSSKDGKYPVALAGRVPVKASLENGPIQIGDYLTSSSALGTAMKATNAGRVIGLALESYNENDEDGFVMVFINPHWSMGSLEQGSTKDTDEGIFLAFVNNFGERLKETLETFNGTVKTAGEWVFEKIFVKTARVEKLELVDQKTGEIYCTWIEHGEWVKTQGDCENPQTTSEPSTPPEATPTPESTPEPSPVEIPSEEEKSEGFDTPQEEVKELE